MKRPKLKGLVDPASKKKRAAKPLPLVTLTVRGAATHTPAQAAAIRTWVALKMLDYHQDRVDFDDICVMRYYE